MLVKNSMETGVNTAYTKQTLPTTDGKDVLVKKMQETDKAAELTLSGKLRQAAEENILSAQSDVLDVSKADEMIRQANRNILTQADDALKVQSHQSVAVAIELLK